MKRSYGWLTLASLTMAICACGAAADKFEQAPPDCASQTAASMEGEWKIIATGKRFDCDAAREEGDIDIDVESFRVDVMPQPSEGETVTDSGDEADAFVDRVNQAAIKLTADTPNGVVFEGQGSAECDIHFSITERLSNGEKLTYDFDGWVQEVDQATGQFTGSGPGDCKVKGTFTVDRS